MLVKGDVRVCGDEVLLDFGCDFAEILILMCCIAFLQNQAVCRFLMLFCAVFIRISMRLCSVCTPLHPPLGGQEQKHFSPLGTKLYFHVNTLRKNCIDPPTLPPCHMFANKELANLIKHMHAFK